MKHCVLMYLHRCVKRRTSIWSLSIIVGEKRYRKVTIEVDPEHRHICQASGRHNRSLSDQERQIVKDWARQERLTYSTRRQNL